MKFIKNFNELSMNDVPLVGGKNAALGEMIVQLSKENIEIPSGFAVTADAYWHFLDENKIKEKIKNKLEEITDMQNVNLLKKKSREIRDLIENGSIPENLKNEIIEAYKQLSKEYKQENCDVAVRSSATAEDLPTASFAGQQESFLNIKGEEQLLKKYKVCLSSLFTPRAIIYRIEHGFEHMKVALSVGVQKMIRSDKASAGVAFTLDTETGFRNVIFIESAWGLGEAVVQGIVNPDEFYIHKPTLKEGYRPILKKDLGKKLVKNIYSDNPEEPITTVEVEKNKQDKFSLTNDEILNLARMCLKIEEHYSKINNTWWPMDIEWAKDGVDNKIYILQARPETIHGRKESRNIITKYNLEINPKEIENKLIITGQCIGQKIANGKAKVINSAEEIDQVQDGDIIVTTMTDPDWVPAMKRSAGIVTDQGGRTCHAAIVSRELGIPAVIGTGNATKTIENNKEVTIDCSQGEIGKVYKDKIPFKIQEIEIEDLPKIPVDLMINTGDPDQAFIQSFLPVDGVGLARLEFIITNAIKIHPMALLHPEEIKDEKTKKQIEELTAAYENPKDFFIDKLAQQAGTIAAAFYPRPVIIRLSDFKSNEYRNLIGGKYFEPEEENPMIGLRGASRYYSDLYKDAFTLECKAMKKIRETMGLKNAKIMIPFVRTVDEAEKVINLMKEHGLERGNDGLELIMMCEVPSNVILIDDFSKLFDGFSIGSNDLTQLTLAIDRDSALLLDLFDERNKAVKIMLEMAIKGAHKNNKYIGICGQGPSDHPELAEFLIKEKIDSISLNPDTVLPFLMRFKK